MSIKMKSHSPSIILMSILLGLYGCSQVDSSNVETEGIYAKIEASTNTNGITDIDVWLTLGLLSNTVIDLSDGDSLRATAGGITKDLRKDSNIIGDIRYETELNTGNDSGTKLRVSFNRSGKIEAPNSVAYLPVPFGLDMPAPGATFGSNDIITLIWNPAGASNDRMKVNVKSDCGYKKSDISLSEPIDAAGMAEYQASQLIPASLREGTTCETRITLKRRGNGSIDSNFEGGYFFVDQRRSVAIKIVH